MISNTRNHEYHCTLKSPALQKIIRQSMVELIYPKLMFEHSKDVQLRAFFEGIHQ